MADVLLLYTPKGYLSRRSLHHIDRGFAMLPNIGPEFVEALLSRTTNKLASLTECASTQKARSPCFIQGFYAPCSFPHLAGGYEQVDRLSHPHVLVSATASFIRISGWVQFVGEHDYRVFQVDASIDGR